MEAPSSEGNEHVQVGGEDGERVDEGLGSAPESDGIGEEEKEKDSSRGEFEGGSRVEETLSEVQSIDGVPQTSSNEVQVAADETETRPSLDEVWESLKAHETVQKISSEVEESRDDGAKEGEGRVSSEVATEGELQQPVVEIKERARPSSLRTRPSTRAKRNVTFKDDFEKGEEEKVHRPGGGGGASKKQASGGRQQKLPPACLGLVLAVALASLIVYIASPKIPTKPRMWTSAELEKYKGTDNKPPLLVGILGSVFDVSKGWKHYGPGGSYHHFVGRDASRAFVSGNFTDDGLTDSLEGLTPSEIKAIDDWRLFFLSRYVYLGKLVGTFYNKDGLPTKKLHLAEKEIKKAAKIEKQQKLDEARFPNCNSRWAQDEGGEVWCNDGKYPRIAELVTEGPKRGPPRTRCACLEQEELKRPGLKGYDGCDTLSSRCKT